MHPALISLPGRDCGGQRLSAQGPLWVEPSSRTMSFRLPNPPTQGFPQRNCKKKTQKDSTSSHELLKLPKNLCTCKGSAPVQVCTAASHGYGSSSLSRGQASCTARPPRLPVCIILPSPMHPPLLLILSRRHEGTAHARICPGDPGTSSRDVRARTGTRARTPLPAAACFCAER